MYRYEVYGGPTKFRNNSVRYGEVARVRKLELRTEDGGVVHVVSENSWGSGLTRGELSVDECRDSSRYIGCWMRWRWGK